MANKVVVDADFFRKFTDDEPNTFLFEKVLDELGYEPVIHKYVADRELRNNKHLKNMIKAESIEIVGEREYLTDEDLEDYEDYFKRAYKTLNAIDFDSDEDVLRYGYDKEVFHESLGEIRSLYLARKRGYKVFLSDDAGSRQIVDFLNSSRNSIEVFRVADVLILCNEKNTSIRRRDLKILFNKLKKENCKELDLLYNVFSF